MKLPHVALLCLTLMSGAGTGCARTLPEEGPLDASSDKVTVTGQYKRAAIDAIDGVAIENGKLVLRGPSASVAVELPPEADPDQRGKGWALVTEGEGDGTRTLTFTQETSLEDFTITVPASDGQVAYGSLGGRDGHDVVVFAYGSGSKSYWGWASVEKKAAQPAQ